MHTTTMLRREKLSKWLERGVEASSRAQVKLLERSRAPFQGLGKLL